MKYATGKLFINEDTYVSILFILSLFHPIFALFLYVGLLKLVVDNGIIGVIKYIIILSLRGILSVKIGVSLTSLNTLKLMIFIILSIYVFYICMFNKSQKKSSFLIILFCILFCISAILFSFISGSYPITSAFKSILFGLVFSCIILGITQTKDKIDWRKYLLNLLTPFFIISFLLVPFPSYKLVNDSFQGVFNHVNLCGIMCAVYVSCLLVNKPNTTKKSIFQVLLVILTCVMSYLTSSRTGLFVLIIVLMFNFVTNKHSKTTYLVIVLSIFACISIYAFNDQVHSLVNTNVAEFVYKSNDNDILSSRRDTQKIAMHKYEVNHLVGAGFMTPYVDDYVDYSLNMSLTLEPGSIIWSIFGDVGILGTVIFIMLFSVIIIAGSFRNIYLIFCVLGVCSGEMVFFSVNNGISVILYVLIAMYIAYDKVC